MLIRDLGPSLALITILSLSTPAFAENTEAVVLDQEARSSAGTGDTDAPEEIIVTARRRDETAQELVGKFIANFAQFTDYVDQGVRDAAPKAA